MANRKVVPFFCDECGTPLSTGNVCPECKRVLCHTHYYGAWRGPLRRRDGLCPRCAEARSTKSEEAKQA